MKLVDAILLFFLLFCFKTAYMMIMVCFHLRIFDVSWWRVPRWTLERVVYLSACFSIVLRELELVLYFFFKLHALDGSGCRARQQLATEGVAGSNKCFMVGPEH